MFHKKSFSLLVVLLYLFILAGCGGNTANLEGSTSTGAQLVSISVMPPNPTIAVDTDQQCTATGNFSDNTTKDMTSVVIWISSDADAVDVVSGAEVAGFTASPALDMRKASAVRSPGNIRASHPGYARITAKWGSILGFTDVTVTPAVLVSIAVTPTNPSIVKGTTQQFTATGTFSDSTTQDMTAAVAWSTSTGAVGTISNEAGSKGLASAAAAGSTTITAISGNISGTATLTVTGGGAVTLTWDAPTTNTDGSSLDPVADLSTYKIYYGPASQTYTQVMTYANPGTTTITQSFDLSAGTYYFAVTTVDASGIESDYSNEVMKMI